MKRKALCTALAAMLLMTTTVSAEPWWLSKYRVTFDNELGIVGNVSTILGHISSKTTIDIYLHSTDEMKKNAADKINARFSMGKATDENVQADSEQTPQETKFEPKKGKMRKQGVR